MSQLLHDLDVVGSLLIVIALALTLLALNWGGEKYAWSSATVLAPLLIGLASLVAFGIWEWKGRSDGIVDHRIFGLGRNFAVATFGELPSSARRPISDNRISIALAVGKKGLRLNLRSIKY